MTRPKEWENERKYRQKEKKAGKKEEGY